MGVLGEPTSGDLATTDENNSFRQSSSYNQTIYPTMLLGLGYPSISPSSVNYRKPFKQNFSPSETTTAAGSTEEMNCGSRRSCSSDSTSRNSMLLQFANFDATDNNGNRLEDFIRNIKCSGYGQVIYCTWGEFLTSSLHRFNEKKRKLSFSLLL